jgi:hypothetical protein
LARCPGAGVKHTHCVCRGLEVLDGFQYHGFAFRGSGGCQWADLIAKAKL